jgi:hypothetical protein
MSKRQLLGVAAILVVIVSALWYVAGSGASGSSLAPDASVRVVVSATAVGTGSWVRYLVTVKNLADGTFAGDALLIDQDQDAETSVNGPSLSTLARNPQLPGAPASAGQSAYQIHLTVASRTSRTVAVLAPDFFNVIEAEMGGKALASASVDHPDVIPVAVLSDVETAADSILGLHFDRFTPQAVAFNSAREFPTDALLLAGYTTVVVDQFDTASLSQTQVQALRDFVGFGGTLVLAGGSGWRRSLAPLPADLLPLRPEATATLPLAPLAALTGTAADARSAPAATGSLAAGARSLLDAGGAPLVAELAYGAGRVLELAYDPSGDGTDKTPYAALGWTQALGRGIQQVPGSAPMATSLLGPDPSFTALLPTADSSPLPPFWLMALLILLYVGIVGPLGYLAVRRRLARPTLFWLSVPVTAAIFTGAFYLAGSALQGDLQDHEIQVIRVGGGQNVNVLEYHRVLFLHRGGHQVAPAPNSLVAPLTLETFRVNGSTCERCTSVLGGLASGAESVAWDPQQSLVDESGVVYGSVRVVASSAVERAPVGLDAHLSIVGGHVQGTIANHGPAAVLLLEAFSNDGQTVHRADLAPGVAAGDTITVDAQLNPADGAAPPMAEEQLLRAVAGSALTRRGQLVLVGLMPPLPTRLTVDGQAPPGAGLAVLEQPVPVANAAGTLRDVEDKWLVGTSGDQTKGFAGVYDLAVPPSTGGLQLTYNSQFDTSVEIYDWATGAFLPATGQGADPTAVAVPLNGDEVRDGLVRVRVHEPRLSWGANVWVDAAGGGAAGSG